MPTFKLGDKVRIEARKDWPTPLRYRLSNAEGTVVQWTSYEETLEEFPEYIYVCIEKASGDGAVYIGNNMFFRAENLEKL